MHICVKSSKFTIKLAENQKLCHFVEIDFLRCINYNYLIIGKSLTLFLLSYGKRGDYDEK